MSQALLTSNFRLFHALAVAVDEHREEQDNLAQSAYLFFQQYDLELDLLKAEFANEVAGLTDRVNAAFILRYAYVYHKNWLITCNRHSTMATKLLTVCNKTLGSSYFVKVLGPLVQRVLGDPKLRDESKDKPDDCSDISTEYLLAVCNEIFDSIASTLEDIPLYNFFSSCGNSLTL